MLWVQDELACLYFLHRMHYRQVDGRHELLVTLQALQVYTSRACLDSRALSGSFLRLPNVGVRLKLVPVLGERGSHEWLDDVG